MRVKAQFDVDPRETVMGALHDLSQSQSRALLAEGTVGRVAVNAPDGPHVIPVNYTMVDEAIVLRTSPYTVLATYGRDVVVALETDTIDRTTRSGWSVVARGRTEVVTDSRAIERIRQVGEPSPWADGNRTLYLRLRISELSGRRVGDPAAVPSARTRATEPIH